MFEVLSKKSKKCFLSIPLDRNNYFFNIYMYISIDPVAKKKKMFFLLTQMATCLHAVFTPSFMYKKFKHLFNKRYFEGFVLKFKGVVY